MIEYQVGGSLSSHEPSYVVRQADELLAKAIARRDFCYILDSRQMGKSSLMVRAQARLQAMEQVCVTLDLTNLGSHGVTAERWYKGIGLELCLGLNLLSTAEFIDWWQAQGDIPYLQKLSQLISSVLLPHYPQTPVHIFVDEVDSILSLDFAADDWFALIRYCYNQRALDVRFQQIVFVLAGVATPSDLIADKTRTPFNVGYSIELQGFRAEEAMPLAAGLAVAENNTDALLRAILSWTGGQPFLTQKLCQLVAASGPVPVGHETDWVERLVSDRITTHWESQDEPEHLRTIRDRILRNETRAGRLLGLYQKLLNQALVPTD
ncbi:MAG: AAA-like domain-containing protein, partial [Cyanobacteria bacterium J06632_3]